MLRKELEVRKNVELKDGRELDWPQRSFGGTYENLSE
jgi:hypothetical protein